MIGPAGINMKHIVNQCRKQFGNQRIKIRLRGRDSGYLERATGGESADPMQVCVSCLSPGAFAIACAGVNSLLTDIKTDYKNNCLRKGIKDGMRFQRVAGSSPNIRI